MRAWGQCTHLEATAPRPPCGYIPAVDLHFYRAMLAQSAVMRLLSSVRL